MHRTVKFVFALAVVVATSLATQPAFAADAAIAAATPLIEAALIERLRKRALASDGSRQAGPGEYWLTGREQVKVLLALFDADDPTSDARPGEGVGDE